MTLLADQILKLVNRSRSLVIAGETAIESAPECEAVVAAGLLVRVDVRWRYPMGHATDGSAGPAGAGEVSVVVTAQQGEIGDVCVAAVDPGNDVMRVAPFRRLVTLREGVCPTTQSIAVITSKLAMPYDKKSAMTAAQTRADQAVTTPLLARNGVQNTGRRT